MLVYYMKDQEEKGMKNLRKITALLLMAVMVAGMLAVPGGNVQAAKRKVQLSKKKVTLEVGKKVTLKLKNAPKKKKITWSSNKKKVASVSKKGVVTAKKAGKANITAKVSGKKYVCKVTVKKKTKQDTPDNIILKNTKGKNAKDVAALNKIFLEQDRTYFFSDDLDSSGYKWDSNGRLVGLNWSPINDSYSDMLYKYQNNGGVVCGIGAYRVFTGTLDLSGLTALKQLDCRGLKISGLDISKNTALEYLDCRDCTLKSLDVSKNTKLKTLGCSENQLSKLDLSKNAALEILVCAENQLSSLDVSNNTKLIWLCCEENKLNKLDVSKNTTLEYLNCQDNQIKSLDVSKNSKLKECNYYRNDENITVNGWPR